MFGVEDEAMGLVDEVEGLVATKVVGIDDVAEGGKFLWSSPARWRWDRQAVIVVRWICWR